MIASLIALCVRNRALVLLLTAGLVVGGAYAARHITVDAIPDLSDVQVVVRTEYAGQAPQVVQDQVTYPLTTAMLAVPKAKTVRGYSMFGTSFVYVIFEDGTDLYWARSRVLEQLSAAANRLPAGATPQLGPDATGVGWVYEYALVTGKHCPDHPNGLWHDPATNKWYASPDEVKDEAVRKRLVHHRIFSNAPVGMDPGVNLDTCPLTGKPLVDAKVDLSDLRGLQDWYLRYELTAVEGVSEVAPVGGYVKQYQVTVDPVKLLAYGIPLPVVKMAVKASNLDAGGRLVERGETEYMVRGVGYLGSITPAEVAEARDKGELIENVRTEKVLADLKKVALGASADGSPVYLADVADVRTGPEIRRGIAEWNGTGETVGGIVVMRFGENALDTIARVKARLADLETGLPPGVAVRTGYDRSDLINRAVGTLRHTLIEEVAVVSLVILLFLLHARSALVAAFVLPTGVLAALGIMYLAGINANIMSLGGIAISIGVMVDSAIIMVENAHKHLEHEAHAHNGSRRSRAAVIAEAAGEVGPTLFFSLLIITVSFLPIFVLGEQSGRLFKPLAFTKTFAIGAGAVLAVTIVPVLMYYFINERLVPRTVARWKRLALYAAVIGLPAAILALVPLASLSDWRWWLVGGWAVLAALVVLPQKIVSEERNPISRFLQWAYNPFFNFVMHHRLLTLGVAGLLLASAVYPYSKLGDEFMPPLAEGDLLYMPTTDPGLSGTKAKELLQQTDKLLAKFPEVKSVFGKIGRSETATDPAPLSMVETIITLNRDESQWRQVPLDRFYSGWPGWLAWGPRKLFRDHRPITTNELIYGYELPTGGTPIHVPGMNEALQLPGVTNAWTMPIRTRIDMLSTGIKTPVGVKVMGPDLATLSDLAQQVSQALKTGEGTGPYTVSAYAEKSVGGNYLNITIDRDAIARFGLSVEAVQDVLMSAVGGMNVTTTVEGLQRYPVNVRYPAELRDNLPALRQTLVATPGGAQVPLGQLATLSIDKGPPMIKSENARLTSWVYVDIAGLDVGTYVENAQRVVADKVALPPGYSIAWSGQYEYLQAARARLSIAVPLALGLIVLLLYVATKSWLRVGIVLLAVPFSLVGAFWLLFALGYNLSLAVWVGVIALAGLDAETGLVMLLYLDNSFERFRREGRMRNAADLWHAVHDGAVQRIRPKTMTVLVAGTGLLPLLWATGAGADTIRRLAVPLVGGLTISFLMELLVYPVLFFMAKKLTLPKPSQSPAAGRLEEYAA